MLCSDVGYVKRIDLITVIGYLINQDNTPRCIVKVLQCLGMDESDNKWMYGWINGWMIDRLTNEYKNSFDNSRHYTNWLSC